MSPSKKHINFASTELLNDNPIDSIIAGIIQYSTANNSLLEKYSQQFFLTYFDRETIHKALVKVDNQNKKELKLDQFIRIFLSIIQHRQDETLYLAMSLRNLFLKIKQETSNENGVKFSDFTNYLCQKIASDDPQIIVPLKQVPQQKNTPDIDRIRQIDIQPTIISKNAELQLPKIARDKKKKDKKLTEKKPISKFIYNAAKKQIITMGRLSSYIYFYDLQLKKLKQIQPKTYKDMTKQIAILSIAFNQKSERIGAIINGIGIAFWQQSDNYETQKTISKYYGDKIYYLSLFQQWVTTDKNTVYFWDIKEQSVVKKIVYEQSVLINDICSINHLRCICVSYTTKDDKKIFIVYQNTKPIVKYDLGNSGCHTLHYNIASQMIVVAGYHNKLQVFEVENKTYSVNLKKQLIGHSSIITCVSDIQNTNFILSGDDLGQVRIWELNYMKCVQVVKIAKWINQVCCNGEKLLFSDTRLNIMQMDKFTANIAAQQQQVIYAYFNQEYERHTIITGKGIRQLNLNSGKVEKIAILCDNEEQITSAIKISSGILIGTSKGSMKLYSEDLKQKWHLAAHQGEISQLKYDRKTRFIFSLANDNKLMIWPEKTLLEDGAKKVITFKNKTFDFLSLFNEIRVLMLGSVDEREIAIWDYETLKLSTILKFDHPIISMNFDQVYKILIVSNLNDEIQLIKLKWKNGALNFQTLYNGDSCFSGLRKPKNTVFASKQPEQQYQKSCLKVNVPSKMNLQVMKEKSALFITTSNLSKNPVKKAQLSRKKIEQKVSHKQLQNSQSILKKSVKYSKQNSEKKIPSIKLIKQQESVAQDSLMNTLKTLKNIQAQITTHVSIKDVSNDTFLILANSKGVVSTYNINALIREHGKNDEIRKRQSPHMYRPAKEDYDSQLLRGNVHILKFNKIDKISKVKRSYFKLCWKNEVSLCKQSVGCLNFIDMKKNYIVIALRNGNNKIYQLSEGSMMGNFKLNLPLPISWDLKIQKDSFVRRNVYETLLVLDDILSNHGFEMMAKQYKMINISKFLETISDQIKIQTKDSNIRPSLLHEQYTKQDLKGIYTKQNTLKCLQAYKRVKQIKQQMDQPKSYCQEQETQKLVAMSLLRQKQQIQTFLSPKYFSKLAEQGVSNRVNKSLDNGSLQERSIFLIDKVNEKKKIFRGQHIIKKKSNINTKSPVQLPSILKYSTDLVSQKENALQKMLKAPSSAQIIPSSILINQNNNLHKLKSSVHLKSFHQLKQLQKKSVLKTKRHNALSDMPIKDILKGMNDKLKQCKKESLAKRRIL